jgi:predicted Zn finger-like uncharacterized protein
MADKTPIICPECTKQFQVPAEVLGRKIRCKNCGKAFVAKKAPDGNLIKKPPEPETESATIPIKDDYDDEGDGKPYEVTSLDLAPRCPSCANELESEDDTVCLHCGFNLETRTVARTRRVKDVTGGDMFLWLLPGILAAVWFFISFGFVILAIVNYFIFKPPADWEQWQKNCNCCCALWWMIFHLWLMYISGKFAIKRLIQNNKPPEVEI